MKNTDPLNGRSDFPLFRTYFCSKRKSNEAFDRHLLDCHTACRDKLPDSITSVTLTLLKTAVDFLPLPSQPEEFKCPQRHIRLSLNAADSQSASCDSRGKKGLLINELSYLFYIIQVPPVLWVAGVEPEGPLAHLFIRQNNDFCITLPRRDPYSSVGAGLHVKGQM